MADKRGIKHSIKQLQRIKTWQLLVLLVFMAFIAATFLRLNNIGMVERRAAVIAADESGDKDAIAQRLYDLQRYVSAHMNTDMGKGVYLQEQYARDRQAKLDAAANADNSPNIYKQITDACRAMYASWSPYFQCVKDKLNASTPAADPLDTVALPSANEYRHIYASPVWSPDFAGFSLLICALLVLVIIARLLTLVTLRIMLRHRYKSI